MKKKFIIAGGGTGGHIFPALAIANALKKMDSSIEILFVGAKGKMEMEKIPEAGYSIKGLDIAGFNRKSLLRNFHLPLKLLRSFLQVRAIFKEFKPDVAIGVGGYSSFPVLRYAQAKKIPTYIHESNSFAGKSNIMLGKNATQIFVATEKMEKFFPTEKITVTGNPVRASIANNTISRDEGIAHFGLDPQKITVLATGGSLGAKSINEALIGALQEFEKNNLQLIWQCGKHFAASAKEAAADKSYVWTNDFINKMEYAFGAADIVISRAGAMAIAELAIVAKPVIFVPYPYAAEDHQTMNANYLVSQNAGLLITDSHAREKLIPAVLDLASNAHKQKELKENLSRLAVKNADIKIAEAILS